MFFLNMSQFTASNYLKVNIPHLYQRICFIFSKSVIHINVAQKPQMLQTLTKSSAHIE